MFVIKTEAHFFIDFVSGCSNDEENDGHGVNMWDTRNTYNTSAGKPKGKRLLGRPLYICMRTVLKWILNN